VFFTGFNCRSNC